MDLSTDDCSRLFSTGNREDVEVRRLDQCASGLPLAMIFNLLTCESNEDALAVGVKDAERALLEF